MLPDYMGDRKMEVRTLYNGYIMDHSFLTDSITAEFPLEYSSHLLFSDLSPFGTEL